MERIKNTNIPLPIQYEINMFGCKTPKIDLTYKYSKKGYIPDFKFMEDYINQLPYSDVI